LCGCEQVPAPVNDAGWSERWHQLRRNRAPDLGESCCAGKHQHGPLQECQLGGTMRFLRTDPLQQQPEFWTRARAAIREGQRIAERGRACDSDGGTFDRPVPVTYPPCQRTMTWFRVDASRSRTVRWSRNPRRADDYVPAGRAGSDRQLNGWELCCCWWLLRLSVGLSSSPSTRVPEAGKSERVQSDPVMR
jgi:hypothetical protein